MDTGCNRASVRCRARRRRYIRWGALLDASSGLTTATARANREPVAGCSVGVGELHIRIRMTIKSRPGRAWQKGAEAASMPVRG